MAHDTRPQSARAAKARPPLPRPARGTLALALLLGGAGALAQEASPMPATATAQAPSAADAAPTPGATPPGAAASAPGATLAPVMISGRAPQSASVTGFGDVPLERAPLQASVVGAEQLRDIGARRLADLTRLDPAVSDAYNSEGYIDYLTVRGFVIDNRFNYRRDGLPINAETTIPLDNKARIEVLKGTSGMQAGTSAPGGLVNYVVKRPLDAPLSSGLVEWRQPGSVLAAVDLSRRFGSAFGLRVNAAHEELDPWLRDARGYRHVLALAADWRVGNDTLIEAEVENSRRVQPSQPGFSLLGNTLPAPGDPRINLNDQPWSQPGVFDATTGSLRVRQRLATDWHLVVHGMRQHLRTDDRVAFPFGCTAQNGTYYSDRYCPDGTFDLYDYRSMDEQRQSDALDAHVEGRLATGPVAHDLTTGVLWTRIKNRFQTQTYNFAGTGTVDGNTIVPPAPDPLSPTTDRDERSTELYVRDAMALSERTTLWLGLRYTRLDRQSISTDGTSATSYRQSFTTPWVAASHAWAPGQLVYASWGEGVESEVTPNLPQYTNRGQALPSLKSRQSEIGVKGSAANATWNIAAFDIRRPVFNDTPASTCDPNVPDSCTHVLDGSAHHRGIEADGRIVAGPWTLDAGVQWLHARREGGTVQPELNGLRPPNVPDRTAKLQAGYRVAAVPGLALRAGVVYESPRAVLPDNSIAIPGWTRVDVGARYELRDAAGRTWTVRAGIDNLFDRRAWRESPFEYDHVYLFPMAPRTAWLGLQVEL
jgi:iron complex outermembrane receptor protein